MRWPTPLIAVIVFSCGACSDPDPVAPEAEAPPAGEAPIHFTVAVHLENWPTHDDIAFQTYVAKIRSVLTIVEDHGARFTWETKNLIEPSALYDDNILLELSEAGQGVGVHADLGGTAAPGGSYTQGKFTNELRQLRDDMGALGVTARHVSGICSKLDWVTAAAEAGFVAASGQVAHCAQSLGATAIPDAIKDCEDPEQCHGPHPADPAEVLFPWRVLDGQTWTSPTSAGKLVLFHSIGEIGCAAELRADPAAQRADCVLDKADVDATMQNLEATFKYADPDKFNAQLVIWSFGRELEPSLLVDLLERIQPFMASGRMKWATLEEMHDGYVQWEAK